MVTANGERGAGCAPAPAAAAAAAGAIPWHARLVLLRPRRVARALAAIERSGRHARVPNLWQVELGVLRAWHRLLFRPHTVGTAVAAPVRDDPWARRLENRAVRLPFLLREGSVAPWDLSGLLSPPERLVRHLLGTHHDGAQSAYDIELLSLHAGALEDLRARACAVVDGDGDPRARWLRNLCVYEGYHERLLAEVERFLAAGAALPADRAADPDVSFAAFLDWCAAQPATPRAAWRAWRAGELRFAPATPGGVEPAG